jgi:hypothetical protein
METHLTQTELQIAVCAECGRSAYLKRGWTRARYCSEKCERNAVAGLHNRMPGGPSPYPEWLPSDVDREITNRWSKENAI